jgi:hypothetical protein
LTPYLDRGRRLTSRKGERAYGADDRTSRKGCERPCRNAPVFRAPRTASKLFRLEPAVQRVPSASRRPIERAILDRFRHMRCEDPILSIQVGYRTCNLEDPSVGSCRQLESLEGAIEEPLARRIELAVTPQVASGHLRVAENFPAQESFELSRASTVHTSSYRGRRLARRATADLVRKQRGRLDLQIDPIE